MMLFSRLLSWCTDVGAKLTGADDRFDWDDPLVRQDDMCHGCDGPLAFVDGVFCRWCLACG